MIKLIISLVLLVQSSLIFADCATNRLSFNSDTQSYECYQHTREQVADMINACGGYYQYLMDNVKESKRAYSLLEKKRLFRLCYDACAGVIVYLDAHFPFDSCNIASQINW